MTLYNRRRKKIIEALKDKKYRDAYVEESIRVGIPFQIKTLREQRNWKQIDLEKNSGIKQARISLLEDPNYAGFSLSTLKKLASGFDVGLVVRFVPLSDLVKWDLNLSTESLNALSFHEDSYFKEEEITISDTKQYKGTIAPETSNKVIYMKGHKLKKTISSASETISTQILPGGISAS